MEKLSLTIEKCPELRFAHLAPDTWTALGSLPRTGWVNRGVANPETVQDHIITLREIAFHLGDVPNIDRGTLLDMLEIHDWPEAIHGDQVIFTNNEIEKASLEATKFEREYQALVDICSRLGEEGDKIISLWLRFENSHDETASFARQLDKYQAIEKALEYEKDQGIPLFKEFLDYSRKNINHQVLLKKVAGLEAEWAALP